MNAGDFYHQYLEHECCNALRQIDKDLRPGWWGSRLRETWSDGTVFEFGDEALRMRPGVDEMGYWIRNNAGSKLRYSGNWELLYLNYRDVPAFLHFYRWMERNLLETAPGNFAYKAWKKLNEHSSQPIRNENEAILYWARNTKEGLQLLKDIALKRYQHFPYLKVSFFIVGPWRKNIEDTTGMILTFRYLYNNDYRWGQTTVFRNDEMVNCDYPKAYKIFYFVPKDLDWLLERINAIPEQIRTTPDSFVMQQPEQYVSPNYSTTP